MKIEIEDYNIERFKKYLKSEGKDWNDDDDLVYELNKFIEINLGLIF